jgi:DNA-directed RNA polymerase subunit alpha
MGGNSMEPTTQREINPPYPAAAYLPERINLFADQLPSMDQIQKISEFVHSTESNELTFSQQIEANMGKSSPKTLLSVGIGLYILARFAEAAQMLQKATDCKEKYIYLAFALRRMGKFEQAIENLQKSLDYGADTLSIALQIVATYRVAKNFDAAAKELKNLLNFEKVSAEYHYQLARLQEAQGLYDQAVGNYKTALELTPNHQRALFHLAYRCDLSGDEEAAIDYYKQIASRQDPSSPDSGDAGPGRAGPVYVNALLNLAVLYEDKGEFDNASQCIDLVLESHPNHQRAILFKKDIESSKTMVYDEEKEKKKSHKNQILETPISDFELSVRSRNCLKRMNIQTLGDLVRTTEADLLSYKNFGETSLKEIKVILESKGLNLGMALEPAPSFLLSQESGGAETTSQNPIEDQGITNKLVDDLQLSVRSRKCLQRLNIRTISELTRKTEAELLGCKNFGVTSLNEIKRTLGNLGLSLRSLD